MRWGVEYTENGWPSTETCLKELQHCRTRSIGPFVVVGQPSCITEQYIKCMIFHIPPINRKFQKIRTCPILEEKYTRHGRYRSIVVAIRRNPPTFRKSTEKHFYIDLYRTHPHYIVRDKLANICSHYYCMGGYKLNAVMVK